jgi:hypothetical protein
VLVLVLTGSAGVAAQPAGTPGAAACEPRQANLGGIGRASVVAFTGPVLGAPVCATVANLSGDAFSARVADAPPPDALVVAALTNGGGITLPLEGATASSRLSTATSPRRRASCSRTPDSACW